MTNESESNEYNQTSTESYKMTADEIERALDLHDQFVINFDKRMTELGNEMKLESVAA